VKQVRVAASENLETVVFSEVVPVLGNRLTARRCL
jgi:hypothetical protein